MESEGEARDVAYELLMKQVEEYISSKRKLSSADNVLIKDIRSKGESLTMMRGTMYRVFVYVKKSDIEGVSNTTVINAQSGTQISVSDSPSTIVNVSDKIPESEIAVELQPDVAVEENLFITASETVEKPVTEPAKEESVALSASKVESPLSGWKQDAVNSLLKCDDVAAVRARLNRLKVEYKIKNYGTKDRCPSAENSFWAIFDEKGKLVTVLGTGERDRVDYRTMTLGSLEAYMGMNALWFMLAK